jgi:hypothetical protein
MGWENAIQFLVDVKICLVNTTSTLALKTFRFLSIGYGDNFLRSNAAMVELTTKLHKFMSYKMHVHQHTSSQFCV